MNIFSVFDVLNVFLVLVVRFSGCLARFLRLFASFYIAGLRIKYIFRSKAWARYSFRGSGQKAREEAVCFHGAFISCSGGELHHLRE